jgi:hypothetical protein
MKKEERGGATPSKLFCRAAARQPARPGLRLSARIAARTRRCALATIPPSGYRAKGNLMAEAATTQGDEE